MSHQTVRSNICTLRPVVFVMGPRQVGKTSLVKSLINEEWEYITLDDQAQFEIAKADPVGFIRNLPL